jgi:hypothetical protein
MSRALASKRWPCEGSEPGTNDGSARLEMACCHYAIMGNFGFNPNRPGEWRTSCAWEKGQLAMSAQLRPRRH